MEQRLQKVLAAAGVASRREAEKLITTGRVAVDGTVVTELGIKVDPDIAIITVDNKTIDTNPAQVYVLLNKPRGYTSTRRDPHALRVITDLVKDAGASLNPVGRLDVDTDGLIILTNDGDFHQKMTHPSHHVPKTYLAEVRGLVVEEVTRQLSVGIILEDGLTAPAKVKLLALHMARQGSLVEVVLTEGRKRQVRRMLEAVGHPVVKLTRTKVGNIGIGKLKPGEWRFLSPEEVKGLLALVS